MLDLEKTVAAFARFTGLSGEALAEWRGLCEAAQARIEGRLRAEILELSGIDLERLCTAAAAAACCDWRMIQGAASGGDVVRVGDIAVKHTDGSGGDVLDTADYFLAQVADLLEPDGRALWQV